MTFNQGWERLAPVLFVVLWSSGFIGAKLGLPYAEPLTFLSLRLAIVAVLLATIGLALRAPWPADRRALRHVVVAGLLVHGGYLGGVFSAIHSGLSAGVVALIVGLQPVLTAIAAGFWFGERVTSRQWAGLGLGLAGVGLVLTGRIDLSGLNAPGLGLAAIALLSITAGTLYQKRYCGTMDFRTGGAIQYAATGLVLGCWRASAKPCTWCGVAPSCLRSPGCAWCCL